MIMINIFNSFSAMALHCLFKSTRRTFFSIQLVEPNMKHSVRRVLMVQGQWDHNQRIKDFSRKKYVKLRHN